ncbi:hypothetical protein MRB53_010546 [Persea americana]|uniref:Uncharacterized protein n=1 Tax=Persea americana TaxID=3435 RepID=A0ACC2LS66_PERAE|nr:hypothetical protein MRB53_010546 [Persea americana]
MKSAPPYFNLKAMTLEDKGMSESLIESLCSKLLALRRGRQKKLWPKRNIGVHRYFRRPKKIIMKRRANLKGERRCLNGMQRRIKALQELVPNGNSMSLDGLFMEAADYIMHLEMQVKVMQIMVKVLSDSN